MRPLGPGETLEQRLREVGIRITGPRRAILQVLEEAREHLDVEEIMARARRVDSRIHRATVYRTVELLKRLGLLDELDLLHVRGDRHFYELRRGGDHAHLICTSCGRVLEPGGVVRLCRDQLAAGTEFRIDYIRLEVGGTCPDCLARERMERR